MVLSSWSTSIHGAEMDVGPLFAKDGNNVIRNLRDFSSLSAAFRSRCFAC